MTDQSFDPHDATGDDAIEDELFTKEVLATFMGELTSDGHAAEGPPSAVQQDLLRALDEQSREVSGGHDEGDVSTAPRLGNSRSRSMLALAASVITVAVVGGLSLVYLVPSSDVDNSDVVAGGESDQVVRGDVSDERPEDSAGVTAMGALVTVDVSAGESTDFSSRVWLPAGFAEESTVPVVLVPETKDGVAESRAREACSSGNTCIVATVPEGAFSSDGWGEESRSAVADLLSKLPEAIGVQDPVVVIWAVDDDGRPVADAPQEFEGITVVTSLSEAT
ncbi:MAG: hypothetical protein GKR85_10050 [Candidatus Nanopelagicales bacterium]|nr:hypothetical protein [Candidatus Nanopelagicales bacterium]